MNLSGHRRLTESAVAVFLRSRRGSGGSPAWQRGQMIHTYYDPDMGSHEVTPATTAVDRDIYDVLSLGHWSQFGQRHHFMRRMDGQTPYQAWESACRWVRENALEFARAAAAGEGARHMQSIGNACHAVEDSFARGHVTRSGEGPNTPGEIVYIKVYEGADKAHHEEYDEEWETVPWRFNLARNAVVALLGVIFDSAWAARQGGRPVADLTGWAAFVQTWLKPSNRLRRNLDYDVDLIDVATRGHGLDEEELARLVYVELGARTQQVRRVFERLDRYDNSNADDVAEYYVDTLRRNPHGRVAQAVAADRALTDILIRVLDEGWTTSGEQACIDFIRRIRRAH